MQKLWHIQNCSIFHHLTDEQLARLEKNAKLQNFPKGSVVYLPDDASNEAFILASGRIRLCSTSIDGKQLIQGFIEPGEIFGELSLVEQGAREDRAEAVSDSTIVSISKVEFQHLMMTSLDVTLGITKLIGLRRKKIERRLRNLLFRSNRERIIHLLLELVESYGHQVASGTEIDIRLSHQELASIIGATRETVTTVLGEMQSQGLLTISRQKLVLLSLVRLANEVGVAEPILPQKRKQEMQNALPPLMSRNDNSQTLG